MINQAKIADPQGVYLHIQEGVIPFADEEFDLVFSAFVLVEINNPIAVSSEKIQWRDELHVAPASIYVSVKN